MYNKLISNIKPLGFTWQTNDPFLFCVHHLDKYPKGNSELGPNAPLTGRNLGQDFTIKDGWRMYHGERIPGFPAHPHRGFETVTVVLDGFIDHSDSHGGAGRYGNGDVQWMTAGRGLQHAEMFPLLKPDAPNPLELFQIWLNLPKAKKMTEPHYAMLWAENIPVYSETDQKGLKTDVTIVAGKIKTTSAPPPAPDSWANQPENEVGIWLIRMDANATWTLPAASPEVNRSLYYYRGESIRIAGITVNAYHSVDLLAGEPVIIQNNQSEAYLLLLQGKPIGEPIVQHGPFVMNTVAEIQQAFTDYRQTRFGGWPWPTADNVHPRGEGRFAKHANGKTEKP